MVIIMLQVYKDCKNAWSALNNGGYLICDDYIWNFYENIEDNPCCNKSIS